MKMLQMQSDSTEMTEKIGEAVGISIFPGTVVALDGDLGAGKTVFTRGIARGMGIRDDMRSPTYTILIEHPNVDGGPALYHFDTYRLEGEDDFIAAGLDEYFDQDAVCVVEWSEKINNLLPHETIRVRIKGTGDVRDISIMLPEKNIKQNTALEAALAHYI